MWFWPVSSLRQSGHAVAADERSYYQPGETFLAITLRHLFLTAKSFSYNSLAQLPVCKLYNTDIKSADRCTRLARPFAFGVTPT
ncbi:MAG: hypothetical protein FWH27_05690 [Planctomycetaceae bacterium]|nr:hypothetical protein [Planctomycetaceae bacterium]